MSELSIQEQALEIKHAIGIGTANDRAVMAVNNNAYNPIILKEVGNTIKKFLAAHNLQVDYDSARVTWNNQYKCWEYNIKIIEEHSSSQASLAGRTIVVKIFNQNSNTNQNSQDYLNRLNNLAVSAQDLLNKLLPGINLSEDIKHIQEHQALLITQLQLLDPSNPEQHALAVKCLQMFNSYVAAILKKLHKEYPGVAIKLKQLDYIDSVIDRRCTKSIPKKTKDWLKILNIHEARFTAGHKRDILVNVFPVDEVWVVNHNVPLSDVPSTLRNGKGNILPNWFRATTNIFKINGDTCDKLESFVAERSSSFSAIAVNKLFRARINEEIAKNKFRILVRDKIIITLNQLKSEQLADININNVLESCFDQELALTTLLNLPFKHKEENKLPEAFSESPQFKDGKKSLGTIKNVTLSEADVDYIIAHIRPEVKQAIPGAAATLRLYLQPHRINCKTIFHNFASSVLRKLSREKSYNQQALQAINQSMEDILQQPIISDLKKLQVLYSETQDTEVKKTLSVYIKYIQLLKKASSSPENNFMLQIFSSLLNHRLGKEIHITCKSGEDRTGAIFVAIDCALSTIAKLEAHDNNFSIHDPSSWKLFRDTFWNNYAKIEEFSASRDITDMNAIGARGLQSQSKKSNFLRSIVSPLYKKMIISDRMARISKLAFKKYFTAKKRQKFFDLFKASKEDKHSSIIFSKDVNSDKLRTNVNKSNKTKK